MKIRALKNIGSRSEGDEFDVTNKVGDFLISYGVANAVHTTVTHATDGADAAHETTKPAKRNRRSAKGGGTPAPSEAPTAG